MLGYDSFVVNGCVVELVYTSALRAFAFGIESSSLSATTNQVPIDNDGYIITLSR